MEGLRPDEPLDRTRTWTFVTPKELIYALPAFKISVYFSKNPTS